MAERCNQTLVILASRSESTYLLVNALAERFDVAQVVFEQHHRWKLLRYRLRKLGLRAVVGQLAFLLWDRLFIRPRSRPAIEALLSGHDVRPPDGRLPVTEVESVNGPEVARLLETLRPCVVVVSGTGIIARPTLALVPTFVNIHCGITPRYRGVHGAFWAVYEGRPELAGVTVHLVDAGVDTGEIVDQATISVDPDSDTYRTLPLKQYLAGLPLMVKAVEQALTGKLELFERDDLDSKQWFSPTLGEYRRFLRRMGAVRQGDRSV
jgi:folate-dependent phosphoribosylglycinamide formyltransferase PurN